MVQSEKEPKMARKVLNFKVNRKVSVSWQKHSFLVPKHFQGTIIGKGSKNAFSTLSLPILDKEETTPHMDTDLRHVLYPGISDPWCVVFQTAS